MAEGSLLFDRARTAIPGLCSATDLWRFKRPKWNPPALAGRVSDRSTMAKPGQRAREEPVNSSMRIGPFSQRRRAFASIKRSESRRNRPLSQSSARGWNESRIRELPTSTEDYLQEEQMGRGILLWLLGVPIPIIILLMLFAR
ncbi:hypothetical protein FJ423_20520 [Mesorhizobium sp. B2-8-9]|nr:hypothetical protein FJ423_20520 [Mesorhizobium sp. B2-8-9]